MRRSAGIVLYRKSAGGPEFFLVHPGGPLWKNKEEGAWSIPKGEYEDNEDPLEAAKREFEEETGTKVEGEFIPLTPAKQKSGKMVFAWALERDINPSTVRSNVFPFQWPPRSGKFIEIPEVDRGEWFSLHQVRSRINPGQLPIILELESKIQYS